MAELCKKTKRLLAFLLTLALVLGVVNVPVYAAEPDAGTQPAEGSLVKAVTLNTVVRPLGQMIDSFEVKVTDSTALKGLKKEDFTFSGKATAWGTSVEHDMAGKVEDISVKGNVLKLIISGVDDRHTYVQNYGVTCSKNQGLNFTQEKVTKTVTPIADEFEKVRKADGAEFDYNIYTPADTSKPLPVVVYFHGMGDNENLYQNQLAVTWADPENQKRWPCYVIAPVVEQYWGQTAAAYRDDLYEKTFNVIQELVGEDKVDADRIYVAGKSMGGMATYEFMKKYPNDVAAAIAMCGAGTTITPDDAQNLKDIPLWIAHATNDDTVNIETSREIYKKLTDAGSKVVKFREYSDAEMNAAGADGTKVGYHTVELAVLPDEAYRIWLFGQSKGSLVESVTVNTTVKPLGQTMDSFEVKVKDPQAIAGLSKNDARYFTFSGKACGWMNPVTHDMEGKITDVSVKDDILTLTISGVNDRHIYVKDYQVTYSRDSRLNFTNGKVTKTVSPVADKFDKVRRADGFDYNMYTPADTSKPLPVVVVFHGFGDEENLSQNQLAVYWAMEENQKENPCYVIAPMMPFGGKLSSDQVFEEVDNLIQQMVIEKKIDGNRIYVVGKSMGGMNTCAFTAKYANKVAGAIPMCGTVDYTAEELAKVKNVPLWIAHATNDDTVGIQSSRDFYKKLTDAGSKVVKFKEFSDAEMNAAGVDGITAGYHTVEVAVLGDKSFRTWLFAQNKSSLVESVTVNTTVNPLGQMMDSFEVKVTDKTALTGLTKEDFVFSGKATAWGTSVEHDMAGEVKDISVKDDILTVVLSGVNDRQAYVKNYQVTCSKDARLNFTNGKVAKIVTPIADEFEKVRKIDGGAFDYNIYTPENTRKPLPVVIYFHGFGDNENLYQNQLAVTWADPENQKRWPCYVIAPVVENYFSQDYKDDLYAKTIKLVQEMVEANKIDGDRIYVAGKSMGGMATYEFMRKYPEKVAGALALCAAPITMSDRDIAKIKDIPLWMAYSVSDSQGIVDSNRKIYEQLTAAGGTVVKQKEYTDNEMHAAGVDEEKGVGYHTVELAVLPDEAYRNWLFAQNRGSLIESVIVNTSVKPLGQTMDSFEVKVSDKTALKGLRKEDFVFSGKSCGWMNPVTHDMAGEITGISVKDDILTLTISGVNDRHIYVRDYEVICKTNPNLSFTNGHVAKTITPVADDFEKVRMVNGASFDYNLYTPADTSKPLPVVVYFHGFGDEENLYQNQLAVFWAMEENQKDRPCYVIAPAMPFGGKLSRDEVFEEVDKLIQKMIGEGKIDKDRVYVVGKSMGGMNTCAFVGKYADKVAGAIAMCGTVDYSAEELEKVKNVPLWLAHATNDDTVNIQSSRDLYKKLTDAGSKVVKFKEYSDAEMNAAGVDGITAGYHTVELAVLGDKDNAYSKWLFAQNKGKDPVIVDMAGLNAAITAASSLKEADYTKETWSAFQTAFTAAKNVAEKNYATQAEVDAAKKALEAAKKALKKVESVTVKLNKSKLTLGVKETFKLTAKVTPSGKSVTWKSDKKNIVEVKNGKITAKKKGTATITATVGSKKASCKVTVKAAPNKITVTPKNVNIKKGKTYTLKVKLPKNTASNKVTFTSSNKKVATVSANGKVKGVKKGKATITVKTFNNKKAKVNVTVK